MSQRRPPQAPGDGHPDEALAAFTDGTATPDERALVLSHLQGCGACRHDVEVARRALGALASLPEPPSPTLDPESIVRRASNVAGIEPGSGGRRGPARLGAGVVAGGLAGGLVAAGLVFVLATGAVKLGGGGASTAASGGAGSPAESHDFALGKLSTDFSPDSIDRLAAQQAQEVAAHASEAAHVPGASQSAGTDDAALGALRSRAASCTGPQIGQGERVLSVVVARFEGRPAFVAVTRSGSGAQDVVRVVVTDRANCTVLYSARASVPQS